MNPTKELSELRERCQLAESSLRTIKIELEERLQHIGAQSKVRDDLEKRAVKAEGRVKELGNELQKITGRGSKYPIPEDEHILGRHHERVENCGTCALKYRATKAEARVDELEEALISLLNFQHHSIGEEAWRIHEALNPKEPPK